MKCSHTGHPFPYRLLIFFNPGKLDPYKAFTSPYLVRLSPPREDYHLSLTTLGDYRPLERITTSLSQPLGDYQPLEKIITSLSLPWGVVTPSSLQPLPWGITNPETK